jgi:hypothetical protein
MMFTEINDIIVSVFGFFLATGHRSPSFFFSTRDHHATCNDFVQDSSTALDQTHI